jgi:hypothetical protein
LLSHLLTGVVAVVAVGDERKQKGAEHKRQQQQGSA